MLLGLLILAFLVPMLVEMVMLGQKFGPGVTETILFGSLHLLAGIALGLALVIAGAWGFAHGRRRG